MDIEGSEKEVFETSASWIDKVGVIIIELHDHYRSGCSRSVYTATKNFEFGWRKGEKTFLVRKDYAPGEVQKTSTLTDSANGFLNVKNRGIRSIIISVTS